MGSTIAGYPCTPLALGAMPMDMSGTAEYGLYTSEATQRHAYGRRMITWDGRVFKYALTTAAITTSNIDQLVHQGYSQHIDYGATIAKTTIAGATEFVVDISATMGKADDGVIAKNEMAGGSIIVYSDTIATIQRGIIGNSAVATGEMTVYVDAPIPVVLTVDASYAEGICSPYYGVAPGEGGGSLSMLGMPQVYCDANTNIWIQTWGVCWVSPQSDVGDAAHDLQVVARSDGSLQSHAYGTAMATLQQHVGFVLSHAADGTQGAPFIMLQISI